MAAERSYLGIGDALAFALLDDLRGLADKIRPPLSTRSMRRVRASRAISYFPAAVRVALQMARDVGLGGSIRLPSRVTAEAMSENPANAWRFCPAVRALQLCVCP